MADYHVRRGLAGIYAGTLKKNKERRMKRVTRSELRGKRLDDDCKKAYTSSHEFGENDNRVFCLGLYDIETDYILDKCWSCRAFVDNAKPLPERSEADGSD